MSRIVGIVPAKDRADTVGATVRALLGIEVIDGVIVVDDGSSDATGAAALAAGAEVVTLEDNRGKGGAVRAGIDASGAAGTYVLIDADTGASAAWAEELLAPVLAGTAKMSIAVLPPVGRSGGFGFVRRAAAGVIEAATGLRQRAPLSGQRAIDGPLLRSLDLAPRFGLEVGLTIDAHLAGSAIVEVPVEMTHRPTGRSVSGFAHRGRQGRDLVAAAASRIGWWRTARAVVGSVRPRSAVS